MKRVIALHLLALAMSLALPAAATVRYAEIAAGTATAPAENGCPAWVLEGRGDDCSYAGGAPLDLDYSQWLGPLFSAGYYAPLNAPLVFDNAVLPPGPVTAPAPELPLGGKQGIPVTRGFIVIDDRDTPGTGIDDLVGGTLEFGAFQRNVAVSGDKRVIESIDRVIHRISPVRVSGATPNGDGGFDYVVATADGAAAYPDLLTGSTTDGGGFSDDFPSEVGSQSTADPGDTPYWTLPPSGRGIARLDGTGAVLGTGTAATVWGYSCDNGSDPPGPLGCTTNGINWDGDSRAAFSNVLLRISTDGSGSITSASAFLVGESDISATVPGNDSWVATTLDFAGAATEAPQAYDDRAILTLGLQNSVSVDVLANDLVARRPVKSLEILTPPAEGTATVPASETTPNRIVYTKGSDTESEQTIVYRVTDDDDATATAELRVLVTDAITCEHDEATANRDESVTVDVTANDEGFDIPPVTLSIFNEPDEGTAVVNPDRSITFTPPPDTGGAFEFSYRLNDGSNRPVICLVDVRIPALPQAVDDVAGVSVDTATSIDVLANDLEISDTPLVVAVITPPQHGTATIDSTGDRPLVRYMPAAGYTGADSFSYQVTDSDGDASGVANVAVTVFGPPDNDLPACTTDTAETDRGVAVVIDVLANDTGLNAAPVSVEVVSLFPDDVASAVVNPDNTITFTPPDDDTGGLFTITYRAREALHGPVQCLARVRVDDLPVAVDNNIDALNFGKLALIRIVNNDTGLSDQPIELQITQQPAHGTLVTCQEAADNCLGFTPGGLPYVAYTYDDATGYPAVDTFRYRITDEDGDTSDEATVTITVRNAVEAEDDPDGLLTAVEDFRTAVGVPLTLDVLANDSGFLRTPINVVIEGEPAGGSAVVNSDMTVTFTPLPGYVGFGSFTYRVTDADGDSDTAAVTLFVFPGPVSDSGSSAVDPALLAALAAVLAVRRRLIRRHRH